VLVKDKVIEGYARTSATPPGQRGDAFYLERIAAATVINEATALYNQERYVEALGQYRSALAMPTGEQIRVMNGIYLASAKLGRTAEAEQAFGRVVALGIAYNELGVKFLFNPAAPTSGPTPGSAARTACGCGRSPRKAPRPRSA
jgi:tetratricopeptide (TPR) repeat protein